MSLAAYRAKSARDRVIRDAVARACAPGLLDLIESGQPLNDPAGLWRRSMNDNEVFGLICIIADYRHLQSAGSPEQARADAALACGHGYYLTDSCPSCDGGYADNPQCSPLIALVRTHHGDDES